MKSNLKKLREASGMGCNEIAKRIGMHQASYSILEKKGFYAALERAYKIADVLGVSIYEIWPHDGENDRVDKMTKKLHKTLNNAERLIRDLKS